jgi:SAM-dependent methyltransferase
MPEPRILAEQLRKPQGQIGTQVAISMNMSNEIVTNLTYDLMDLRASDSVLEIGFGNGKLLPPLIDKVRWVAGIDFSEDMIAEAEANNRGAIEARKLELKYGTVSTIPYPDATFDKVCTINTLYFWPDPLADLKEIKRVLKPGGVLGLGIRTKETLGLAPFTVYGFTLYSTDEAVGLLEKAGFTSVATRNQFEDMTKLEAVAIKAEAL